MRNKYAPKQAEYINALKKVDVIRDVPSVKVVEKGIILPRRFVGDRKIIPYQGVGGCVDSDGNFVKESCIYDLINTPDQKQLLAFGGAYQHKVESCSSSTAIYMGLANTQWGHFIIDVVQRCWFLIHHNMLKNNMTHNETCKEKGYCNEILKEDYVLVFSGTGKPEEQFRGNHKRFFELLGVDVDRIKIINEPTQYDKIIVPDVSVYPGQYIHAIYRDIFKIVVANAMKETSQDLQKYDKVYFSRAHLNDIKDMGEESIESQMKKNGFEILYPEELSLTEQIFYWNHAKEIACINGTIPHNAVFAKSDLKLYVFNKMERMVGYQFTIDMVWEGEPEYISAYHEPFRRYPLSVFSGPFWITITPHVSDFLRDKFGYSLEPKIEKAKYFKYVCLCVIIETKTILSGVKSILKKYLKIT